MLFFEHFSSHQILEVLGGPFCAELVGAFLRGGVTEVGGLHTAVRGTMFVRNGAVTPMFVRNGAVTPGPSNECDITFFVKGQPKYAQQSRESTVAARRVQSVIVPGVPSSRVTRECRQPILSCEHLPKWALVKFGYGMCTGLFGRVLFRFSRFHRRRALWICISDRETNLRLTIGGQEVSGDQSQIFCPSGIAPNYTRTSVLGDGDIFAVKREKC